MITLRLDSKLEQTIDNTAKYLGMTKSELIRRSIQEYLNKIPNQTPWDLGKDLFGKYSSGNKDLSAKRKKLLKRKIRAKSNEKNTH